MENDKLNETTAKRRGKECVNKRTELGEKEGK